MPRRQQNTAMATLVLHILQARDQIRDAAQAQTHARQRGPGVGGVAAVELGSRERSSAAARAVDGRGGFLQVLEGNGVLVA